MSGPNARIANPNVPEATLDRNPGAEYASAPIDAGTTTASLDGLGPPANRQRETRSAPLASWTDTLFEQHLTKTLTEKLPGQGPEYVSLYVSARTRLLDHVLEDIRGAEPQLTDHGPRHVRHVLENAFKLLQLNLDYFDPLEYYILGLSILFHDAGNLHGREDHNKRIGQFYDDVRSGSEFAHEKALVVRIARSHTGRARNGSGNTLGDVPKLLHYRGEPIRARELAAIVRFADELAEGEQRTSQYMKKHDLYEPGSVPYHDYSASTAITIDGGNDRIAVTYQFDVLTDNGIEKELAKLKKSLQFALKRLAKLDVERRYARYHCAAPLLPFQKISVCLDIQIDGEFVEPFLEANISDEVDPDHSGELLSARNAEWEPDTIVERIRQLAGERVQ